MDYQRVLQPGAIGDSPNSDTLEDSRWTTYQYTPLNERNREFRLLRLLPLPKSAQVPLQCQILHVSLNRHEKIEAYEAISYYWGDPTPNSTINIQGTRLNLPKSSERALRRLALPNTERLLYLDAVCINQSDLSERATQVQLMGDIYRNAQATTLVYFDEGTSQTASQALTDLRLLHLELQEDCKPYTALWDLAWRDGTVNKARHPPKTPVNWHAIMELFQYPWFRRVWVVQEIALAKKSLLIYHNSSIPMTSVLDIAIYLRFHHADHIPSTLHETLQTPSHIWFIRLKLARKTPSCCNLLLSEILPYSHGLQATDPRDKVYGILGLLSKEEVQELPVVDYTKPIEQVFRDATRRCFADPDFPLAAFSRVWIRDWEELLWGRRRKGFPTWAARLELSGRESFVPNLLLEHGGVGTAAAGDVEIARRAVEVVGDEADVIVLKGVEICRVVEIGSCALDCSRGGGFETLRRWIREAGGMGEEFRGWESGFARTLVANTCHVDKLSEERYHVDLMALLGEDEGILGVGEDIQEFQKSIIGACHMRKFAIMSSGKTALVPALTERGDEVVMMHGAYMPVVLKADGESGDWLLLGNCYVDGWMMWQENGGRLERRLEEESTWFRIR
ncbi:uncharacterized protein RCC_07834 [Ramularia collo-cygni]|uniref:Heterokaryon incompatibility domain-containing protein n=1 Tax=Ramularia collo-cygni TaxID=112498 RepID=A0A2D3VDS5_9PEZI|nr:uncharacterized protein RCC_07834 [Ramularia collo-cygni]CZT21966.1 uncharacterized protein RCC_07834 [Ramularia collo-cygni]